MRLFLSSEEKDRLNYYDTLVRDCNFHLQRSNELDVQRSILVRLVKGCTSHSSYRMIRPPTNSCESCKMLYNMANILREQGVPGLGRRNQKKVI